MAIALRGPDIEIEFAIRGMDSKVKLNGEDISHWCRSVRTSASVDEIATVIMEIYPEKLKLVITDPIVLEALEVTSERPNPLFEGFNSELDKAKRAAEILDVPTLVIARAVGDYRQRAEELRNTEKTDGVD